MIIISVLRDWREARKMTQAQLGQLVGLTDNAISQFERGISKPRITICFALANVLAMDPAPLMLDFYGVSLPNHSPTISPKQ